MKARQMPDGFVEKTQGRISILARRDIAGIVEDIGVYKTHDPSRWKGAAGSISGGRTPSTRIRLDASLFMVVKPLLRGGVMRWFNRSLHGRASRLHREVHLSNFLQARGVPVVSVLFGRAERVGFMLYRFHLGSEEFADSENLLDLLTREGMDAKRVEEVLESAGQSVRALHDAGVYHCDLNFTNLLTRRPGEEGTDSAVMIIDLDRSVLRADLTRTQRTANLARLLRHAVKNRLDEQCDLKLLWNRFLEGYSGADGGASRLEKEVDTALRQSLFFHRIGWWIQGR